MLNIRKAEDRGKGEYGWLKARYSFSFANYYNPDFLGFRDLLVINEDVIAPAMGFGEHPHNNMEIITYVIEGALEHQDSMGHISVIRPGEVQYMRAGSGVRHSEYNHHKDRSTHLLQIWIKPFAIDLEPTYEQKNFLEQMRQEKITLLISPDGKSGSIKINQDAKISAVKMSRSDDLAIQVDDKRHLWIQMVSGEVEANGQILEQGDGVALSEIKSLNINAKKQSELLIIDLK